LIPSEKSLQTISKKINIKKRRGDDKNEEEGEGESAEEENEILL
jgi:hypothetical protein